MRKILIPAFASILLSSCGLETSSSIDDPDGPYELSEFVYVGKYCGESLEISIFTPYNEKDTLPSEISTGEKHLEICAAPKLMMLSKPSKIQIEMLKKP